MTGFSCPQSKEDHYRLLIDEALKSIEPPIFTDAYTVCFKPIMEDTGQLSGNSVHMSLSLSAFFSFSGCLSLFSVCLSFSVSCSLSPSRASLLHSVSARFHEHVFQICSRYLHKQIWTVTDLMLERN